MIPVTNYLFSSEIITEYIHKCVTQNPHIQSASTIALECQLYVTLDHNPELKLEKLLNVFMKVESNGPDVVSMIRKVSIADVYMFMSVTLNINYCITDHLSFKRNWGLNLLWLLNQLPNLLPNFLPNLLPSFLPNLLPNFLPNLLLNFLTHLLLNFLPNLLPNFLPNLPPNFLPNPLLNHLLI